MRFAIAFLLALTTLPVSTHAASWWNSDWGFREKITIDANGAGIAAGSDATRIPMLVRLHAGNFNFEDAQVDGADLRVIAADDKTPVPYQLEAFDGESGVALLWIAPGQSGPLPPYVWLYFGNPTAKPAPDTRSPWDGDQIAVLHFDEKDGSLRDATSGAHHASRSSAHPMAQGIIGAAQQYDGQSSTVLPDSPSLKFVGSDGWTVSMWVRPDGPGSGTLFHREDRAQALSISIENEILVARLSQGGQTLVATSGQTHVSAGSWHHVAVTAKDHLVLYIDGSPVADVPMPPLDWGGDVVIGGLAAGTSGTGGFHGAIDEVLLARHARSAAWLHADANAGQPDTRLIAYADEEAGDAGTSSYLATIGLLAGAVSVDGWVVIGLIALLGLVSAEIGVNKAILLRRAARANDEFLAHFRREGRAAFAGAPGAVVDDAKGEAPGWTSAPLFNVFKAGADEFARLRQGATDEASQRLDSFSFEVVRSAVDTTLTRELNRISDKMVLLTLAVSGAPFLGLLGTVVGIMITFATIALKGDVNINTIAPGIAAALTATTAGMLVAIPALFGYNILQSRIKGVTEVMDAFRDELLAKIAASINQGNP